MAKENRARYAILGMLHYGDFTGYEIRKRLKEMIGSFWQEPSASVYPTLKALEGEGLVTARRETPESGMERIRYSVTGAGRAVFGEWLAQDPAPTAMRNEFALKVLFGGLTEEANVRRFIEGERARATAIEAGLAKAMQGLPEGEEAFMWRLIADYGRALSAATEAWCARAVAELDSRS